MTPKVPWYLKQILEHSKCMTFEAAILVKEDYAMIYFGEHGATLRLSKGAALWG